KETLLFTTPTCPNCKMAKKRLTDARIYFRAIDATQETELAKKFGVQKAPTLVLKGNGEDRFENVSDIKKYIEERKKG
ncbi:MAG: thioredoxin family protein, partial [Clostridia bacterium]|nr:thioredoxin family protein [Clostridia bacterium]